MGDLSVTKYSSIKLPKDITNRIDSIIETKRLGYQSRAEFVKEAIRDKILELRHNPHTEGS